MAMMGPKQVAQGALFYAFSIEDHVPQDHLLRAMDRFVDLSGIRLHLASYYSSTGRPSVDPELMIRMLLVGYTMGIRSERRLCEEVHLNLAYRWFCRLDLTDTVPDHSTFSKNRHGRFRDSDLLRHVFETVVARCITEGLVSGQRFAVDASLIEADTNRQNSSPQKTHRRSQNGRWMRSALRRLHVPCASIWRHWMTQPSGPQRRSSPSSPPIPIPPRNGRQRAKGLRILPMPPTT
jgi:transposase